MSRDAERLIGSKLSGGRYEVLSLLGEGGMGLVFKARDANLDADVVIKIPRRSMLDDPEFAERFAHEVRALVQLSDPHIVKVSDVGEHEGLPFAVMQYLAGGSLEDRHGLGDGRTPILGDPAGLAAWLPSVGAALDFAHQRGYIHRDVKPANILFDARGNAYLGDFGVAKLIAAAGEGGGRRAVTGTGMVLGTAGYMAPEVILGQSPDGRIDQYALGVTAFEVLSGKLPFVGPSPTAVLVMQSTRDAPSLADARPGLPPALCRAIDKSLARDPKDRYPDCASMARAVLDAAAGPVSTPAKPTTEVRLRLDCPACASPLGLTASMGGKRFRCPSCKSKLRIGDDVRSLAVVPEGDGSTMEMPIPGRPGSGSAEVALPALPRPGVVAPRLGPIAPPARHPALAPALAAVAALLLAAVGMALWPRRQPEGPGVAPSPLAAITPTGKPPAEPQRARPAPAPTPTKGEVSEALFARAKEAIGNQRLVYARSLLKEYLDGPATRRRPEAQSLLGWIDLATSEERARAEVAALGDDDLAAFAAGGPWPRAEPIGNLPLQEAHLATLRRNVPMVYSERQQRKALAKRAPASAPAPKPRPSGPSRAKFEAVAADPSAFDGREVLLEDVCEVATKLGQAGGHRVLPVRLQKGKTLADGVALGSGSPLVILDPALAGQYQRVMDKYGVTQRLNKFYRAILMVRVGQVDVGPDRRWAAVVVFMQILVGEDRGMVADNHLDEAFHAIEVSRDDAHDLFARGDDWLRRLGGETYAVELRRQRKEHNKDVRTKVSKAALNQQTSKMMSEVMEMKRQFDASELRKRQSMLPGSR